jgi:hypothetical protein
MVKKIQTSRFNNQIFIAFINNTSQIKRIYDWRIFIGILLHKTCK